MRVFLTLMCLMVCLSSAPVNADNIYPESGTMLPPMPTWWPIWFPFEEPPMPVPPIPTPIEIFESQLDRLEQLDEQIDDLADEIAFQKLLLGIDPDGMNAPMIQMQINMLQMQKAMLEAERQALRNSIEPMENA